MQKLFLTITACLLALCASVGQAQVGLTVSPHSWVPQERLTLFGEEDVLSSSVAITTGPQKVYLSALVYRIEGCSSRNPVGSALLMLTLNTPLMIVAGQEFQVDQARFVRFPIETTLPPNTSLQHTVFNDVASYTKASEFDKKCVRLTLERSGVETKAVVGGNFPLQGSALTIVRSKPVVMLTPIGPTTNRIRTASDDVFRINIAAGTSSEILIKELNLRFSGAVLPAGGSGLYQIIHDASGIVLGFGDLQGGNVVLTTAGELYVDAGSSLSLRVRVNSSEFQNSPNNSESLSVQIVNPCDFQWDTSTGNTGGPGLCLESQVVPITTTVSYQ